MKTIFSSLILLLALPLVSVAQDFIYFKDGTKMEVKIVESNALITIYEMPALPGKHVQMNTEQIAMIQYESGKSTIYLAEADREAFIAKLAQTTNKQVRESTQVSGSSPDDYSTSRRSSNVASRRLQRPQQQTGNHAIGLNLTTVGSPTKYVYGEYERLMGNGVSMSLRLAYYSDWYYDSWSSDRSYSSESESEEGVGLGVSCRYYVHGQPKLGGFFVGSAVDFIYVEWEWSERFTDYRHDIRTRDGNSGTSLAMAFTGQIGYKFVIGKSLFIEPSVIGGHYASNSSDATIESGVILMPGVTVGLRLK